MKVIVFYRPNGEITVRNIAWKNRLEGESEDDFLARVVSSKPVMGIVDCPYDIMEDTDLPQDRSARGKWRGVKDEGISIDNSIITRQEKMEKIEKDIDAELVKPNPDIASVMRLQRKLQKGDY